jgi:hypothetical protein
MRAACQLESKAHAQLVTNNDNKTTILATTQDTNASYAKARSISVSNFFSFSSANIYIIKYTEKKASHTKND